MPLARYNTDLRTSSRSFFRIVEHCVFTDIPAINKPWSYYVDASSGSFSFEYEKKTVFTCSRGCLLTCCTLVALVQVRLTEACRGAGGAGSGEQPVPATHLGQGTD